MGTARGCLGSGGSVVMALALHPQPQAQAEGSWLLGAGLAGPPANRYLERYQRVFSRRSRPLSAWPRSASQRGCL